MPRKPIEIDTEVTQSVDERTGITVKRTTIKKGLLNRTSAAIEHDPTGRGWVALKPHGDDHYAVEWLKGAKIHAQLVLSAAGLPTDHVNLYGFLSLQGLIEPLSKEEAAANLIDGINAVLALDNKEAAWAALKFASALHTFLLATGINEHVMADVEATENRKQGPKKKSADAEKAREIIKPICEDLWLWNQALRQSRSETARKIETQVNDALLKAGLKQIRAKAIAEHIGKIFPSMANNGD